MNSEDLKTEMLSWLRYLRGCDLVCTEAGYFSADVWGISGTRLIEIETKISLADLKADFKKPKHQIYQNFTGTGCYGAVPNAYYFAMPEELVEKAQAFLATVKLPVVKKYGIIKMSSERRLLLGRNAATVVQAKRIHTQPPSAKTREVAIKRMASELCGTREAMARIHLDFQSGFKHLTATMQSLYAQQRLQSEPELEEDNV